MSGIRIGGTAVAVITGLPFAILEGTDRGGSNQQNVWLVKNGTLTRITPYTDPTCVDPPCSEEPVNAILSPDRQWVAYNDNFPAPGGFGVIDVVAADGSSVYPIANRVYTDPVSWAVHPSWHPDGTKILCCGSVGGTQGGKIVVSDFPPGSSTTLWTPQIQATQREVAFRPHYSPDGTKIAFLVNLNAGGGGDPSRQGLWTMDADGSNAQQIVSFASGATTNRGYLFSGTQLAWSHDSQWIVYAKDGFNSGDGGLFIVHPDGTNETEIAAGRATSGFTYRIGHGAWAADDSFVIATRTSGASTDWRVCRVETDGSGATDIVSAADGPAGNPNFECAYRHPVDNRIYWVYATITAGAIRSCAIDGTDIQTVYDNTVDVDGVMSNGSGIEWI